MPIVGLSLSEGKKTTKWITRELDSAIISHSLSKLLITISNDNIVDKKRPGFYKDYGGQHMYRTIQYTKGSHHSAVL